MDTQSAIQLQCLEMTTKRKLIGRLVPCRCFRGEEEVISVLDYSHCSLQQVPKEIFSFERTLEELYLDANQIEELPKQLFNCQALRKLSIPDNDLSNLPTTIASLVNLKELDISKNGIQEFPDNIKGCKCLTVVEASVNPIAKLPDGFTQLPNLTQLFLNDAFLEHLPANFGKLSKLRILELRENHLKTLPKSIHKLTQLERLDLGSNEFAELPDVLEQIHNLKELWMDNNSLQMLPGRIGRLKLLKYLDLSKNRIESLDMNISGCEVLEDLLLSSNMLQQLPDSIGLLKKLTSLKVNENQLTSLPNAIGSLSLLEEFDCSSNELESLPPTIGYLHNLRTFAADENFLSELPREIGNCRNVTVMSLRSNKLEFLPDEIGQMTRLRVLNLSDNRLKNLPYTFAKLKDLAALWLSDNQSKALIPLQSEANPETKQRVLTNYMFPQQPRHEEDYQSDSDSFNPTLWEEQRQKRMTVAFEFEDKREEDDDSKVQINLKRYPTPYPEDLKNMVKSVQNMVGKAGHTLGMENCSSGVPMEYHSKDAYEHNWAIVSKEGPVEMTDREDKEFQKTQMMEQGAIHSSALKMASHNEMGNLAEGAEDTLRGSPNDIRMSDMRPTLVEPSMYKPKVVLLGKEKKESLDESDADKMHCLNNSGSSPTYSDYSPSQGSSGSSNPQGNVGAVQPAANQAEPPTHWSDRVAQSIPQPMENKPMLTQRDVSNLQQHSDRRQLSNASNSWSEASPYENTNFAAEEPPMETPSGAKPMLGSRPRSASAQGGRRPLVRQDRIVSIPLDLEHSSKPFHTPDAEVSPPHPWQNWTRTPSAFEDRTAFPSRLELSPENSPGPHLKDFGQMGELPGTFVSTGARGTLESQDSGREGNHSSHMTHLHGVQNPSKAVTTISRSTERLFPMMRDVKAKFKKSQSIDEIDIGSCNVYSIPLDSYNSSTENPGSLDRPDIPQPHEQSMSRSQSAPMLDEDMDDFGSTKRSQEQKPTIPKKVFHFDQSFSPQGAMELMKPERRSLPPFPNTSAYVSQPGMTLSKELMSPRGYGGHPSVEQMFSFSQPSVNKEPLNLQFTSQRSRPGCLRRADSLVSATELAVFRRMAGAQEFQTNDHYGRPHFQGMLEPQGRLSAMADSQFHKRNGRYTEEYSSYQEPKMPIMGYPTKSLTQRRPLSARSYSTESYGTSQARPVSARPTMAALLERVPSDYTLSTCTEKTDGDNELRTEHTLSKMPLDWRQQLLRHIDAKQLDWTSSQSNILENQQGEVPPASLWAPYSLARRDVPPENVMKKLPDSLPNGLHYPQAGGHPQQNQTMMLSSASAPPPHRLAQEQPYENKVSVQQYQSSLPVSATCPRPQSARCILQTKGQKGTIGYQEQFCVRIDRNPGLGFSISGGISGQGNPFKPSDMGIFVTRVQPDGPACNVLQPGDKILKVNGHSFLHMEHESAVSLLKSFQKTVDLVILRENTA